ncbi:hypothetical protein C7S18_20735 [Ahniella affigens]|uniref:Bacterial Ig-like domain-containing protein n=1 Tax=Ahniella affigens TaxID=2021234 RepID=A0A2P1PX78_9GAMM|nr:hypothetical protein [Ahniella affigens]AVP99446.1 hypothetical protein C7S18_20735 [Ahniella affigens]
MPRARAQMMLQTTLLLSITGFSLPLAAATHGGDCTRVPPTGAAAGTNFTMPGSIRLRLARAGDHGAPFVRADLTVLDQAATASMVLFGGVPYLYYTAHQIAAGQDGAALSIGTANGNSWQHCLLSFSGLPSGVRTVDPDVILRPGGGLRMYFTSNLVSNPARFGIHYADSTDGLNWTYVGEAFLHPSHSVLDSTTAMTTDGTWHQYVLDAGSIAMSHASSATASTFTFVDESQRLIDGQAYKLAQAFSTATGLRIYAGGPGNQQIRSFTTSDGVTLAASPTIHLSFVSGQPHESTLIKDPAVVQLGDGSYLMAYSAGIGNDSAPATTVFANSFEPGPTVVETVPTETVNGQLLASSSKLRVRFPALSGIDHVEATASAGGISETATGLGTATELIIPLLEADREYSLTARACRTADCSVAETYTASTARTGKEHWRLVGTGHDYAGLINLAGDSNARLGATRIGADSGLANAGHVQLYYGARISPGTRPGLFVADSNSAVTLGAPSSWSSFTSLVSTTGLRSPPTATPAPLVAEVNTGQGVPFAPPFPGNAGIRLFFEARGADGRTRVLSIDSQDGLLGRDFHSGAATQCSAQADYQTGGPCAPRLEIGVQTDAGGHPKIRDARQMRVTYPLQDDWRWQTGSTTKNFMVITVDLDASCGVSGKLHAYARWNGSNWVVENQANGCPKLFTDVQACSPMHLGGDRYKMYCGVPSITTGAVPGSPLPFLGPKRLAYGYGRRSGNSDELEFEDWTQPNVGADVVFLWPDDTQLNDTQEGYIDDFHFLPPAGNLDFQLAYVTLTDGTILPFGAVAKLVNP